MNFGYVCRLCAVLTLKFYMYLIILMVHDSYTLYVFVMHTGMPVTYRNVHE